MRYFMEVSGLQSSGVTRDQFGEHSCGLRPIRHGETIILRCTQREPQICADSEPSRA
jgi:hypothetical protein